MAKELTSVGYETEKSRRPLIRAIFVLASFMAGIITATQHFAWQFSYHQSLGWHIRHIYFPGMIAVWYARWSDRYPVAFRLAISYGVVVSGVLLLAYVIIERIATQSATGNRRLHGTAHWATPEEIHASGLLGNDNGVYIGGWKDALGRFHYLRDNGPAHVLCFAPTRSGKGVGLVLPTLLSWSQSAVISDLKGELWHLTSGWRKSHGHNIVLRFEPGLANGSARWNPLDEVRLGTSNETGDIRNLTNTIIDTGGKGHEDFWVRSAGNLLEAIITHILYKREREKTPANMQAVTYFLNDPDKPDMKLADKFQEMMRYHHYANGSTHKLVASMGKAMSNKPDNERGSVISTMDSVLGLYKDPVLAKNTGKSDFHLLDLMDHDRPVSLYLITTPDNMDRLFPLLRLLVNMMLKKLAAHVDYEDGRTIMAHKHRMLLMLDEFPAFGKLQPIADSLAYIAGYGIKAYLIAQDTVQFDAVYGDKNSIISNCHTQIAFPPNRLETARYVSQMLGEATILERQYSVSGKRAGMLNSQVTESVKSDKRPLLTPDEVMALSGPRKNSQGDIVEPGEMIVRVAGAAPIRGRQPLYFTDTIFLARAKIPPPAESDRIGVDITSNTECKIAPAEPVPEAPQETSITDPLKQQEKELEQTIERELTPEDKSHEQTR